MSSVDKEDTTSTKQRQRKKEWKERIKGKLGERWYNDVSTHTTDITSPFTVLDKKWRGLTLIWIIDVWQAVL